LSTGNCGQEKWEFRGGKNREKKVGNRAGGKNKSSAQRMDGCPREEKSKSKNWARHIKKVRRKKDGLGGVGVTVLSMGGGRDGGGSLTGSSVWGEKPGGGVY